MTPEITLVLAILTGAIVLFASEKFGPDLIALMVLVALTLTGTITINQAFSGFASPAVITVWAIYIISEGLFITGVADFIGTRILGLAGTSELRLIVVIMLTAGLMSSFMNNIGSTAVLLPAVFAISKQTRIPASKLLIPLAFASLMGGNLTLIGTPPNILASDILREYSGEGFQFFDFLPMGILILVSGIVYMALVGRYLLPDTNAEEEFHQTYNTRYFATEIVIAPDSPLIGQTIEESRFGTQYDLAIISKLSKTLPGISNLPSHLTGTRRLSNVRLPVQKDQIFQANDVFLVQGQLDDILKIKNEQGIRIGAEITLQEQQLLPSEIATVTELVIPPTSSLQGKTLKSLQFRDKFNLTVLALWRDRHTVRQKLADMKLRYGDVLLVQGPKQRIELLENSSDILPLEPLVDKVRRTRKAPIALGIIAVMLIAVTFGWLHISIAAVTAVVVMVASRVLSMDEAYNAIEWRSVFLIAGMLPLGIAMETSGTAQFLADLIVSLTGGWGAAGVLFGLYVLTMLLTQPMSNAAATVLVGPIAIQAAVGMGADPRPFLMAVVLAASTAFLTPIGHQSNVLVYGVGGYKFTDFTKVGLGLSILYLILIITVLPIIWPLYP